jgi:hypothetical protein
VTFFWRGSRTSRLTFHPTSEKSLTGDSTRRGQNVLEYFRILDVLEYFRIKDVLEYFRIKDVLEYFRILDVLEYFRNVDV